MAGKRLRKRRKKQGKALLISRLIRLGMLVAVLALLGLAALGIHACAQLLSPAPAPEESTQQEPVAEPEKPATPVVQPVYGVVTVDPGHGGADPGCGEEGALEKEIVIPISMHLKELLEQAGVTVVMTRQADENLDLDERAEIANLAGSDLFVSIHCNSYEGEARGMDCYYHKNETAKQLAQAILDKAAGLGIVTRQIQKNNYQVLWDTDMPAVLVETGFVTDPQEYALLQDADYQRTVAQAVADAVLDALRANAA